MYQNILNLYKPVGKTPLDMIRLLQSHDNQYAHQILGYAGRLDPMAEGVLLILVGEENKKRKLYERFDKEYIFEILFGVTTDTYDPLGIVEDFQDTIQANIRRKLEECQSTIIGKHEQPYPPYSSARVNGKPLFYWARENKLSKISIPVKTIEIKRFNIEAIQIETLKSVYRDIVSKINLVNGDFRQPEILTKWEEVYRAYKTANCVIARCKVTCSSGTYIRSLVHQVGQDMGTGAIALSIKRTRVGDYQLQSAITIRY